MKYELGISVYPDLRPLEEIEAYFELASRYKEQKKKYWNILEN